MLMVFSEFQVNLALAGFLVRGGISNGLHYMDDDIVFGHAFLEAVELDTRGGPPRLALASSVVEVVRRQMSSYTRAQDAPHYDLLFEDTDGTLFLNYLVEAFLAYPDGGVFLELIEGHMRSVKGGLETYRHKPDVRAKYEWATRYHNFFCHEFARCHPVPSDPDTYPEIALAAEQAQRLLDYLIDIEAFDTGPRRISL
jgi:hypothetical protein